MSARHMVSIICDRCGAETGALGERSGEARVAAISAGWTHPSIRPRPMPGLSAGKETP